MLHEIDKKLFSRLFKLCFLSFQISFFNDKCVFVNGSRVISNPTLEFRLKIELYNVSIFIESRDKAVQNLFHAIRIDKEDEELYWTLKRDAPNVKVDRASFTFGNLHHCNFTSEIAILKELDGRYRYGYKIEFNEKIAEACSYPLDDMFDNENTTYNCESEQSGKRFHFVKHDGKTYELVRLNNKLSVEDQLSQMEDNSVRLRFVFKYDAYYVVYENTSIKIAC